MSTNSPASGFAPTFIQFLDVVHQIQKQFPSAFEFNDFYLRFLAYHSVSCRFRTFLLDCECERVECGITAVEDKRGSLPTHHKGVDTGGSDDEGVYPGGRLAGKFSCKLFITGSCLMKLYLQIVLILIVGTNQGPNLGQSIFDYIDKQHMRFPIFYNFMYTPDNENSVGYSLN